MLNRIRVVTLLMLVLVVFALLQLLSGSFLFSSLHQNQQSFALSNSLRTQQTELTKAWDLMLQTRINLSRSSARISSKGRLSIRDVQAVRSPMPCRISASTVVFWSSPSTPFV